MKNTKNMTNAEKMAIAIDAHCSKDGCRPLLSRPYHDKENGVVVATDAWRLIATPYNFNPLHENADGKFPTWEQVVPFASHYSRTAKPEATDGVRGGITFERLRKILDAACKLAKATGGKARAWFPVAGEVVVLDAAFYSDFLLAMEAGGGSLVAVQFVYAG